MGSELVYFFGLRIASFATKINDIVEVSVLGEVEDARQGAFSAGIRLNVVTF